jgi:GNAT superfamily N-acetyltransferase
MEVTAMKFQTIVGKDCGVGIMEKTYVIDQNVYEEKYWGEQGNSEARYLRNPESFICVMDEEADRAAGYMEFFPCEKGLYEDIIFACDVIRDDDIAPAEIADYSPVENHIFILSLAVHQDYQGTGAIVALSDAFIEFLARKNETCPITDITATVVSEHGKKAMKNYRFEPLRQLSDGNTVYICRGENLKKLLAHQLNL